MIQKEKVDWINLLHFHLECGYCSFSGRMFSVWQLDREILTRCKGSGRLDIEFISHPKILTKQEKEVLNMFRKISILLVSVFLFLGIGSLGLAQEPIRIGAVLSLTGFASFMGQPEKNTFEMLEKEVNKAGGINGHPIKVIIYDDKSDATESVLVVKRLVDKDKVVAILGPSISPTSLATLPTIEEKKVPAITFASSALVIEPVRKWAFKIPHNEAFQILRIFNHMKSKGITKIGVISATDAYGDSGRAQLLKLAPAAGIEILGVEKFNMSDTDMSAQLTRLRSLKGIQAIQCWAANTGPAIVAKNYKDLGITLPSYHTHGIGSMKFIELAGEAAEGILFPSPKMLIYGQLPADDPQKAVIVKYNDDYEKNFKAKGDLYGANAFDAFQIMIQALKKAGPTPEKIRDEIEKTKNFVATNGIFNYSPTNHGGLTEKELIMVRITKGGWKLEK
jgi:branched-chain amino acid transport system substrate-binding protein